VSKSVVIQGEPLAVQIFEAIGKKKGDVLLVHGFTGSKEDFSEIGPLIANDGYRVITFDNRGQHESSHTKRVDGYSMPSLGRDVLELSKFLELNKPHLLGHSFGGLIAQQAVNMESKAWSSLTLMCSGPGGRADWLNEPQFENLNNETKAKIWKSVLEPDRLGNSRFELLKKRWIESDANSTMIYRDHLREQASLIGGIARSAVSFHVIYGENDDAWPIEEQNNMARNLSARLTILPGCGHCPNEENPELLTRELLDFWERE
jgi:pimeloyl-ACP methyl ester carboxylesterase